MKEKMNLKFYIPSLKDYWYEQKIQSDKDTMSYNKGYSVSYDGYHYETGCIDFPKEQWEATYEKRKNSQNFFAYLEDVNIHQFVGYVNYHYNVKENRYECGIVIESVYRGKGYGRTGLKLLCEHAKHKGIKELYDTFEINRGNTLKMFEFLGFEIVEKSVWEKNHCQVQGVTVRIRLNP